MTTAPTRTAGRGAALAHDRRSTTDRTTTGRPTTGRPTAGRSATASSGARSNTARSNTTGAAIVTSSAGWVLRRAAIGLVLMLTVTVLATLIASVAFDPEPDAELRIGTPASVLIRK